MRNRAARLWLAMALAIGVAGVGVALPHWTVRGTLRDAARVAAASVQGAAAAGLPGSSGVGSAHSGVPAADAAPAPAVLLLLVGPMVAVARLRTRRPRATTASPAAPRAPPARRL